MSGTEEASRCGLVAVVGAPNAGKSTLVNALAGTKVSIVSPKPQTTRFRIRAVVMHGRSQIVLVDTPGIFRPRRRLDRAMVAAAWGGAQDADLAMLIVDARAGLTEEVRAIAERLRHGARPTMLLLNKADLIEPPRLLPLSAALNEIIPSRETVMVSALKGRGLDRVLEVLAREVPEGRQRTDRRDDLRQPRHPEGDPDRRCRRQGARDRPPRAGGAGAPAGTAHPPFPQREGALRLG